MKTNFGPPPPPSPNFLGCGITASRGLIKLDSVTVAQVVQQCGDSKGGWVIISKSNTYSLASLFSISFPDSPSRQQGYATPNPIFGAVFSSENAHPAECSMDENPAYGCMETLAGNPAADNEKDYAEIAPKVPLENNPDRRFGGMPVPSSMSVNPAYGLFTRRDIPMEANRTYGPINTTMQPIKMSDNPAYGPIIKPHIPMEDNPAYGPVVRPHIPMDDNPAYISTSIPHIPRKKRPAHRSMETSLQSQQLDSPDDYVPLH